MMNSGRAEDKEAEPERFRIDEMDLTVGLFREEAFGPKHSLFVSRKNVVDLREKSPGLFIITGVRSGVVYIDEKTPDDALVRRLLVRVRSEGKKPSGGRRLAKEEGANVGAAWEPWCGHYGLRCDGVRLWGDLSDWSAYASIMRACQATGPCLADSLALTPSAAAEAKAYFAQRLGAAYRLAQDVTQIPLLIEAPCRGVAERVEHEERVNRLLGKISDPDVLLVRCQDEVASEELVVRIKAFFLSHEEVSSIGLALGKPLHQGNWRQADLSYLDAYLAEHEQEAHMVGEPSFKTLLGVTHHVAGGSEFLVASRDPEKEDQWKQTGLSVEGILWPESEGRYLWRYRLGLSELREMGESLTANRLSGEVRLHKGQAEMIGSILTKSRVKREQRLPWLSDLPIIGPWLRHKEDTQVEGRLFVRVSIEAAKSLVEPQVPGDLGMIKTKGF